MLYASKSETKELQTQVVDAVELETESHGKAPAFSLIVPVYNEADIIVSNLNILCRLLEKEHCEIVVFDDCSKDGTHGKLKEMLAPSRNVDMLLMHSNSRIGKGGAIKSAVNEALGEVVVIIDADLATDLRSIPELVKEANHVGGIVIGERNISDRYTQGILRVILSLGYNLMVRLLFRTGVKDHQCGFKAMKTNVARRLVTEIRNNEFGFDTELIVFARKLGLPIRRIRVKWRDNRPQRSNLKWLKTSPLMLKDLIMLRLNEY